MAENNGVGIGALLLALVCLSCAEGGQPVEARSDLYLPEEDRSLQSITVEPDGLTLVYDTDARDAGLVEGLLVAGAAQGGYLRQVEQVALVGSTATVQTRDVALTDAASVGTLHETLVPVGVWELEGDGEQATMAAGGALDLGGMLLFEGYSSEADLQVSIAEGSLAFDPTVQLDLEIESGELRQFVFVVSGPLVLDLAAEVALDLKYSYTTEVPLASFRQPVTASIGQLPVVGEIVVTLRGGFELVAASGGEFSEHVRVSSHVRAGAAYDGSGWSSVWSVEPETTVVDDPSWDFDDDASLRLWIIPEIALELYGADGPRVVLEPFLDASLTGVAPPLWTLASGLSGEVGVPTQLLDPSLTDFAESMPAEGIVVAENDDSWVGWSQVSAGEGFSCGLTTEGILACWGDDDQGKASPPAGSYVAVTVGRSHACALAADGAVTCWGRDGEGQGSPPDGAYAQLAAGNDFTCAIKQSGEATCWGRDAEGQTTAPGIGFAQVSAGARHGCGVTAFGEAACWGNDTDGQASPPAGNFDHVSAGRRHSCGLEPSGGLVCWGCSQIDTGGCDPPGGPYTQVSVGGSHSCAVNAQDRVSCWGAGASGQAEVPLGWYTQVSAGEDHTCAVRTSGEIACWGGDDLGQSTPPEVAP